VDGGGHADLAIPRGAHEREHLLEEERISLGGCGNALAQRGLDAAQLLQELFGLYRVERLEQHGRDVPLASTPGGALLEELGTCHAQQEHGSIASELGHVFDEVE
jgi:nucleotidyltransferase/DNA polymerase involved in DNA repair